ncbi:MAG TPA: hypothetical protein VD908_08395 [Cytophagales bacterium]|nr:hypothetical protein [Cytophagales bacterium]
MIEQKTIESIGARTSLGIGLPLGLIAIIIFTIIPVAITGETLFLIGFLVLNGYSTLFLLISFSAILWFSGKWMAKDISLSKNEFLVSFKYSVVVNAVIWSVFILVHIIVNKEIDTFFGLIVPSVLAGISIIITPLTVGILILKVIKYRIKKATQQIEVESIANFNLKQN